MGIANGPMLINYTENWKILFCPPQPGQELALMVLGPYRSQFISSPDGGWVPTAVSSYLAQGFSCIEKIWARA